MTSSDPSVLGGLQAWHGEQLDGASHWQYVWPDGCLDELTGAVRSVVNRGIGWDRVERGNFPLQQAAEMLRDVADTLEHGPGLAKLGGLPIDGFSREELKILFYGVCSWLGQPVCQSNSGEFLGEICDEGSDVGERRGQMLDENGKPFLSSQARTRSPQPLRWHTDRTDVVGLLSVNTPVHGGASRVASAVAIHDEMIRRRPDLAAVLYQDLVRSRLGEEAGGAETTYALPVFSVKDGKFATHYSRTYVEAAQKLPNVKRLTDKQWEALDLLASLADELCYDMTFAPGDMQFLNNHVIYHARDAFEDDHENDRFRLLYRVWVSMSNSRTLPDGYEVLFGTTAAGAIRGGIGVPAAGLGPDQANPLIY